MKIVRFSHQGHELYGVLEGDRITPLESSLDTMRPAPGACSLALADVRILPPVMPTKIVAIGLNYLAHARETGHELPREPMLFLKPSTAVIAHGDAIVYPPQSKRTDYEGELAIVIGRTARNVPERDAHQYVLGYTCMNDVTARDLQRADVQFTRSKGFDTFAPLGPAIVTDLDPSDLLLETRLNGETRQRARTSDMIFKPGFLVSFVSHVMTLLAGDVISTGTPSGIGPMQVADVVEVEIEKIGCLRNTVVAP